MNGVLGFTELLAQSDLNDEQERQVQLIADSGRAMMRLLNDILDMSKIDAGQMQLAAEPIDVGYKLRSCARLMEPIARAKGVELTIAVGSGATQMYCRRSAAHRPDFAELDRQCGEIHRAGSDHRSRAQGR